MCPVRSCPPVFTMSTLYCLQTADHLMDRGLSRNRLAPTVTSVSVCVGVLSVFPATISHGKYWVCCRCSMLAMWGEVRGRTNFPWCDLLSLQDPGSANTSVWEQGDTECCSSSSLATCLCGDHLNPARAILMKTEKAPICALNGWNAQAGVNTEQGTVI